MTGEAITNSSNEPAELPDWDFEFIADYDPAAQCRMCGEAITGARNKNQRYCSPRCRNRHNVMVWRIRHVQPPAVRDDTCEWCQEPIEARPGQMFCSAKCKQASWRFWQSREGVVAFASILEAITTTRNAGDS